MLALGALVTAGAASAPHAARGRLLGPVVLLVVALVVVLQVAAAAHGVLRVRGGVESLVDDRAAVTAVVVVTGDALMLTGRGDRPGCCGRRPSTCSTRAASGAATGAPVLLTGDATLAEPAWRSTMQVRGRLRPTEPRTTGSRPFP